MAHLDSSDVVERAALLLREGASFNEAVAEAIGDEAKGEERRALWRAVARELSVRSHSPSAEKKRRASRRSRQDGAPQRARHQEIPDLPWPEQLPGSSFGINADDPEVPCGCGNLRRASLRSTK